MITVKIGVDFVGFLTNGDLTKVASKSVTKLKLVMLQVLNQICMKSDLLDDFNDVGCYELVLSIPFTDRPMYFISENIRERLNSAQIFGLDVRLDVDELREEASLEIILEDAPDVKFTANIVSEGGSVNIVSPRIIGV